jgi:hypothetical protein
MPAGWVRQDSGAGGDAHLATPPTGGVDHPEPERLAETVAKEWTLVEMAAEFGCHFPR